MVYSPCNSTSVLQSSYLSDSSLVSLTNCILSVLHSKAFFQRSDNLCGFILTHSPFLAQLETLNL